MIRKILIFSVILSINKLLPLYAQNSVSDITEFIGEDLLNIIRSIDERRVIEQSKILNLNDLPGTFWVTEEPFVRGTGGVSFFYGYIFINNNCILDVLVVNTNNIDMFKSLSISPTLYIAMIYGSMTYRINDDKIAFDDDELFYLENTYLYARRGDKYIKCRLESRFSIWNSDP
jgi:hypothetical protein